MRNKHFKAEYTIKLFSKQHRVRSKTDQNKEVQNSNDKSADTTQEHVGPNHFFTNALELHTDTNSFIWCGNKFQR